MRGLVIVRVPRVVRTPGEGLVRVVGVVREEGRQRGKEGGKKRRQTAGRGLVRVGRGLVRVERGLVRVVRGGGW